MKLGGTEPPKPPQSLLDAFCAGVPDVDLNAKMIRLRESPVGNVEFDSSRLSAEDTAPVVNRYVAKFLFGVNPKDIEQNPSAFLEIARKDHVLKDMIVLQVTTQGVTKTLVVHQLLFKTIGRNTGTWATSTISQLYGQLLIKYLNTRDQNQVDRLLKIEQYMVNHHCLSFDAQTGWVQYPTGEPRWIVWFTRHIQAENEKKHDKGFLTPDLVKDKDRNPDRMLRTFISTHSLKAKFPLRKVDHGPSRLELYDFAPSFVTFPNGTSYEEAAMAVALRVRHSLITRELNGATDQSMADDELPA